MRATTEIKQENISKTVMDGQRDTHGTVFFIIENAIENYTGARNCHFPSCRFYRPLARITVQIAQITTFERYS